MISENSEKMAAVREALALLFDVREAGSRALVSVPVQYPSGALSVVELERQGKTWWISDMGHGLQEAEFVSAGGGFSRAAKDMAKAFGVKFDGHAVFALMVPDEHLDAGIVAVSNASVRATIEAIRSETEKRNETKADAVFDRLTKIFRDAEVTRKAEIAGEHALWEAHNVVRFRSNSRTAIFELMTPHPQSVSAKFLMFSDLKRMPNLSLNAVVSNPDHLDSKGRMIDEVAHIIRFDATDDAYRRLAAA